MTTPIDTYGATLTSLADKTITNADVTSRVSESVKPEGNQGIGYLVAHFVIEDHLKDGETELAIGTYDLGEVFPAKAYVAGDVLLDVTEPEVGAGDLHVQVEGGTAAAAGTAGKSVLAANEFVIGTEVGGLKLQAMVDTGVITAGAYTIIVPYRISGYEA